MTLITPQKSDQKPAPLRLYLLHGVGLCAQAFDPLCAALDSARFCAIERLELPAHGNSVLAPMQSIDDGVAVVLEALKQGAGLVVGHSLGALIALRLACKAAQINSQTQQAIYQNLRGVVLMNAVYQRTPQARQAVIARADSLLAGDNDPEPTLDRWYGDGYALERAQTKAWLAQNSLAGYGAAYRVFAQHQDESLQALAAINLPVCLITGSLDKNSTPLMSESLARNINNAKLKLIHGAGHMALMTHPYDCAQILNEFAASLNSEAAHGS